MPLPLMIRVSTFVAALVCATSAGATIVSDWNAAALDEVRRSRSLRNGPPIVARALAIAHTCMYDAWAAYDDRAVGTTDTGSDLVLPGSRRRPEIERTDDNKKKAISFAAYRCLTNLYPDGEVPPDQEQPSARLKAELTRQGYSCDEDCSNMDANTAAGIGNIAAQAVINGRRDDGSNQYGDRTPVP